jgi:hypothetical protein
MRHRLQMPGRKMGMNNESETAGRDNQNTASMS